MQTGFVAWEKVVPIKKGKRPNSQSGWEKEGADAHTVEKSIALREEKTSLNSKLRKKELLFSP